MPGQNEQRFAGLYETEIGLLDVVADQPEEVRSALEEALEILAAERQESIATDEESARTEAEHERLQVKLMRMTGYARHRRWCDLEKRPTHVGVRCSCGLSELTG